MLVEYQQSFSVIEMLVHTSWDGLTDRDIGMVQVFYKERAALGFVVLVTINCFNVWIWILHFQLSDSWRQIRPSLTWPLYLPHSS